MTKFLPKSKLAVPALALLCSTFTPSCTEVDKRLGEDFIPPNQALQLQMLDASGFITLKTDTLAPMPTSSFSVGALGRISDPRLGKTTAGFVAQLLPATTTFTFEDSSIVRFDSVCLILGFSSTYGSDKTPMNVEVYELKTDLHIDSAYYGTPDVAERFSKGSNLAANSGVSITAESSSARINLKDDEQLFDRLFSHTSSADSFLTYFKGLYVKVADNNNNNGAGAGGCVKYVSLVNTNTAYASSAIVAYYHFRSPHTGEDSVASFSFHVFSATPRFNVFEHSNNLHGATDTLYMQGFGGVVTQLTVNLDSVEAWTGAGSEKKRYAISRAELVLHVLDETDYTALDAYATQLQCIVEASSEENGKYASIVDMYDENGDFSAAFDGALNRSPMQYSLNLTYYFNGVVKGAMPPSLWIIPYGYTSDASSALINNKDKKPQLKLTYVEIVE
jgi:hypothetical protein